MVSSITTIAADTTTSDPLKDGINVERIRPAKTQFGLMRQIERLEERSARLEAVVNHFSQMQPSFGVSWYHLAGMGGNPRGVHYQNLICCSRSLLRYITDPVYRHTTKADDLLTGVVGAVTSDLIHATGILFDQPIYWIKKIRMDPKLAALELSGKISNTASSSEEALNLAVEAQTRISEQIESMRRTTSFLKEHFMMLYGNSYDTLSKRTLSEAQQKLARERRKVDVAVYLNQLTGPRLGVDINLSSNQLFPDIQGEAAAQICDLMARHWTVLQNPQVVPSSIDPSFIPLNLPIIRFEEHGFNSRQEALDHAYSTLSSLSSAHTELATEIAEASQVIPEPQETSLAS